MSGGPISGVIADQCGRKTSLVLSSVPYFTGYLMISYAHYLPSATSFKCFVLIGRILTGIGVGFSYSLCTVGDVATKIYFSVYLSVHVSVCLFVSLSVNLSIFYVCLSNIPFYTM